MSGDNEAERNTALSILHKVLVAYSKLLAPVAPFISEEIFKNLTSAESVHLQELPEEYKLILNDGLMKDMILIRKIAEVGHARRKESGIKLRQPLAKLIYKMSQKLDEDLEQILADELNIKKVGYEKSADSEPKIMLDTKITPNLAEEGEARDLIRKIQQLRKEQGLILTDKTKVTAVSWPVAFEKQILNGTASVSIEKGPEFKVQKV